jgi:DMSO/TMAO reductase YedYZ molybdopterin-dependent catalytic subunit
MRRITQAAVLLSLALALSVSVGCGGASDFGGPPKDQPRDDTIVLDGVEVRDYQGERLDSVNDFRENSIAGVQNVEEATYRLSVGGLVDQPKELTYSEVTSGFPGYEKVVRLDCVEGWSATVLWRGVLVRDLIDEAGAKTSARTVIFRAVDGYSTSFPIEYFYDRDILLAYQMNGVTLPDERGFPFQVVAEDKWGYKWCKWVTAIELSDDVEYRGYWESRGYANDGDLDKPYYGR